MRRKQIAAAALRDAAQDASLYAKVYDAGFSKLVGDMAEGIEGKEQDDWFFEEKKTGKFFPCFYCFLH